MVLLFPALLIATVPLTPPGWRRHLLLAGLLGAALGLYGQQRLNLVAAASYLPAAPGEVTTVSGFLTADSSVTARGDVAYPLRLVQVEASGRRLVADARASVVVLATSGPPLTRGRRLSVTGVDLVVAEDRTLLAFAAGAGVLPGAQAGGRFGRADLRRRLQWAAALGAPRAGGLVDALLLGSRDAVPASLRERFVRSGTIHVLALSGLHVGILAMTVLAVWRGVLGARGRWGRLAVAAALVGGYVVLAGITAPLLRAATMLVVGGVAAALDREPDPLNVLAIATICCLSLDPAAVHDVSFQLSYGALLGILSIGRWAARRPPQRFPRWLWRALPAGAGAQVLTAPVALAAFGAWYPVGLAASVPVVALATWFVRLAVAHVIGVSVTPSFAGLTGPMLEVAYTLLEMVTGFFARAPGIEL